MSHISRFEPGVEWRQTSSGCTGRIITPPAPDVDMGPCLFSVAPPDQKHPVLSEDEGDTDDPISSL